MKIFDSLTREKKELITSKVKIYACGPTVYNYIHIGNARPLIVTDVLIRYLAFKNINFDFLMNITDIDDKIINKAIADNITDYELAKKYHSHFLRNMADLNITMPDEIITISSKMNEIIAFIENLEDGGSAYFKNGNVYFDVAKFADSYGAISHQKLDELRDGVRIENSEDKKSSIDFTLWKKTTDGKKYLTKWSNGRPGWHTECVALIDSYFNSSVDLHIGGTDLRFPHHENERIQYLAKTGNELAKIWWHIGHVLFDNQKMSKSVGNIITVDNFLSKNDKNDLRFIMLTSKYSQPININDELILQAKKWNEKNLNLLKKLNWMIATKELHVLNSEPIGDDFNLIDFLTSAMNELENDLNTAQVITIVDECVKYLNQKIKTNAVDKAYNMLKDILMILGFTYKIPTLSDSEIRELKTWREAVKAKDFHTADQIRKKLEKKQII